MLRFSTMTGNVIVRGVSYGTWILLLEPALLIIITILLRDSSKEKRLPLVCKKKLFVLKVHSKV